MAATTVVCLNERRELVDRYADYVGWLERNRPRRAMWSPIPDLHAPTVAETRDLLAAIRGRLAADETLLVHCGAGMGRAGTIAAALLVDLDVPLDLAVATVSTHRPMAGPEAGAQAELLAALVVE